MSINNNEKYTFVVIINFMILYANVKRILYYNLKLDSKNHIHAYSWEVML